MRAIIIVLLSISAAMQTYSQNNTSDRQPVAAGRFYPGEKVQLEKQLSELFVSCKKTVSDHGIRAVIAPHAGYVYSGRIAASAYSSIDRNSRFKNIFIIGSSHVMSFDGASAYRSGDFITPLGRVKVNRDLALKITNENRVFAFPETCHINEHSIEVQLPFIQHYLDKETLIVPIIIGTDNIEKLKEIARVLSLWFNSENLFIISSDFSHYPSYSDAIETDKLTSKAFITGDPSVFLKVLTDNKNNKIPGLATSMCGWTSGLTLLYLASGNKNISFKEIDYCNSGDSGSGSKNEVVGYHAISVSEKSTIIKSDISAASLNFDNYEKKILFSIARNSIKTMLYENKKMLIDVKDIPEKLKIPGGAFVTLKLNNSLRGCIGRFISSDPLYSVIQLSAISSAFEDPRFSPLTEEEFEKVEIEITVLGQLVRIHDISEISLGRHGIYIKKDNRSGTMLPQVATENGWTVEQFLGFTSRDKAGIGWDGWKDAELYIYEGLVLHENNE